MTCRCSHCGYNGHNSPTCPDRCADRGVRLFGVRLDTDNDGTSTAAANNNMRKSVSMGNLTDYPSTNNLPSTPEHSESGAKAYGSVSDGLVQASSNARRRKKAVPWTEEEHRLFLVGLQKLGKGDWRGISRNFVQSKIPTQVASHAQKYFMRQSNLDRRKRRSSIFDVVSDSGPRPMAEEVASAKSPDLSASIHQLSLGSAALLNHGAFFTEPGIPQLHRGQGDLFLPSILPIAGVPPRNNPMSSHLQQAISLPVISRGTGSLGSAEQVGEATVSYGGEVTVLSRPIVLPIADPSLPSGTTIAGPLGLSTHMRLSYPMYIAPG